MLGGQPVEQDEGGAHVLVHDGVLLMRGGLAVAAEPSWQVPDSVTVQDLTLAGVGPGGEYVVQEAFQAGHLLITWRQGPGSHQHAAQVGENRALRQFIQGGMGELPVA